MNLKLVELSLATMIFRIKKNPNIRTIGLLLSLALACAEVAQPALALQIEGIKIPQHVHVDGKKLQLNGAGMRTISALGIPVNLYVASFYAPAPIRTEQAALAAVAPLQFNFTFLQGVNKALITRAWRAQFSHTVTETYPGYEHDKDTFLHLVGNLDKNGRDSVEFVGNDTRVLDSGRLIGVIHGRNFQKAYLSLLFGPKPASRRLKPELLGLYVHKSI
jgi:hypothetical protein